MVSSFLCIFHDFLFDVHEAPLPKARPLYANSTINTKNDDASILSSSDSSWRELLILKAKVSH